MLPTTTPFPVDMPDWDPSTNTWIPMSYPLPSPIPTVTFTTINTIPLPFLNPELLLNSPFNFNFPPTDILTTTTTGSLPSPHLMPAAPAPSPPAINADGSINNYSPNYVPGYAPSNTPTYSQSMPSPAPAPPVALARKCGNCGTTESCKWRNVTSKNNIRCNTCFRYRQRNKKERPADVIQTNSNYCQPMPSTVPAPPAAPAPSLPATNQKAKVVRKCSNCGTTESCKWKNVRSKNNIQCNTCFIYRQRNNKDRPAAAIEFNQEIKMKRL